MFDVYCPGHQARVLLGPRCIAALVNTSDGVEVHWTCRCGTSGVLCLGERSAAASARHTARTAA